MSAEGKRQPDTTKLMIVSQNATLIWGIVSKIMGANFCQTFHKIKIEKKQSPIAETDKKEEEKPLKTTKSTKTTKATTTTVTDKK